MNRLNLYYKKKQIVMCDFNLESPPIAPEIPEYRRPIVIIYAHKRMKSVLALPLTSAEPPLSQEKIYVHIPKEKLFGRLRGKDSWVLCDMIYHLSYERLFQVYDNKRKVYLDQRETKVGDETFAKITDKVKGLF